MVIRQTLCAVAMAAAAVVGGGANALAQAGPPPASWSASDCATCHEKAVNVAFKRTPHAGLAEQCASCHTGVAEHFKAQAAGEANGPVPSLTKLDQRAKDDVCLQCHEKGRQVNWHGGMHERRGTGCTNCHGVHDFKSVRAQLKTVRDSETCFSCHKQMRAKMQRTSHHPVREGKMECSSCHDPHDSTRPKMVSATSVNDKCYECHTEKRGPFVWEHSPVRESCVNCHDPHGSNHPRMMVAMQPYLCQRCHANSGHPGTIYDLNNAVGGALVAAPAVAGVNQTIVSTRILSRGCINCHAAIHGTNAPSGVVFGR